MTYDHVLHIDIETRSSADIKSTGVYRYAQDPHFGILLIAYALDDGPVKIYDLTQPGWENRMIRFLGALSDTTVLKIAYNAAFEWYCLNRAGLTTPLEQWRCTMAHALYCGYPASLEAAGKALGIRSDKQKLTYGKALIRLFCTPQKPTKSNGGRRWTLPKHEPEKWEEFKRYNMQDVEAEREIEHMLSRYPMPESEWELWRQDVRMNAYGARVDRKLIEGALYIDAVSNERLMDEARRLTGLDNPNSTPQLLGWLEKVGCPLPNLQKATVADALDTTTVPENVRRALEIRQQLGKTSNKKYQAAADAVCDDDRVRGLLQYYGANRSGRWAGRLVQIQNLPRG